MKIWLDFCEPKSVTMLRPLYDKLQKKHDVFITARDFDSTIFLLEKWGIDYIPVGNYGGETLLGKLKAYAQRLKDLILIVEKHQPEFLFCITSPEAMRISFGLQIPNIMFNDEPRSYGPCSTTFPYINKLIVPYCIPLDWYLKYGLKRDKIIRFNGIDEVGWLSDFVPNETVLDNLELSKVDYFVCRTEPTTAGYLINKMKKFETKLTKIIPRILSHLRDITAIIITRNNEQYDYLVKYFKVNPDRKRIRVFKHIDNLTQVMFFSKLVLSGGGTMVRESSLLGIPSIEFFPLETYPQEQFLIDNGFPLIHTHEEEECIKNAIDFITDGKKRDTLDIIKKLENPIDISIGEFTKQMSY